MGRLAIEPTESEARKRQQAGPGETQYAGRTAEEQGRSESGVEPFEYSREGEWYNPKTWGTSGDYREKFEEEDYWDDQWSLAKKDIQMELSDPTWQGGQETTWAKEELARGENALVKMHELDAAFKRYQGDLQWERARRKEFINKRNTGEIPEDQTYSEFMINELWKQIWSEKGMRSQPMIDKARELGDIQSRDPAKFWDDKPDWQTQAEKEIAQGFEAMAGRTEYVGGNRMYAGKAISNAATKIRGKMSDSFIRGREVESNQAGIDLKDFLANASIQGEQALVALDERRQQFKLQQDAIHAQDRAAGLSFAGTLIASFISAVAIAGSDERLKTVTGTTKTAAYQYLDSMRAAKYHMPIRANAGLPEDEFGIMAQSLEDSELGSQMVQEMLGVKTVEPNHAVRVTMVAQKELHERLKRLERLAGVKELLDVKA